MNRFYKMCFPPPYSNNYGYQSKMLREALNEMRVYQNKDWWDWKNPAQKNWRRSPGHERRIQAKEKSRQKDREKIKELISIVLSEKEVMKPPSSLRDLNFNRKK